MFYWSIYYCLNSACICAESKKNNDKIWFLDDKSSKFSSFAL